jgi:hypothetical protein
MLTGDYDEELVRIRVASIAEGIGWSNTYFSVRHGTKAYCAPSKLGITPDQHVSILRKYVENHPADADRKPNEIGYVVLKALIDAFPCD